jgi:hypothetical protein
MAPLEGPISGYQRQDDAVEGGEQLLFPGMGPSELPDLTAVVGPSKDSVLPPSFPDAEPVIFKEEGGELSPFQKAQLDARLAEIDQVVAATRERKKKRKAKERDRDERRASELKTARWERIDRRVERYVLLSIFLLGAMGAVALGFVASSSNQAELTVSPGASVAVSVIAGLRLRALDGGDRTSMWDWLISRQKGE